MLPPIVGITRVLSAQPMPSTYAAANFMHRLPLISIPEVTKNAQIGSQTYTKNKRTQEPLHVSWQVVHRLVNECARTTRSLHNVQSFYERWRRYESVHVKEQSGEHQSTADTTKSA